MLPGRRKRSNKQEAIPMRIIGAKKILVRARTQAKKQAKRADIRRDKRLVKSQARKLAGIPAAESAKQN
jgi:hypothetical protein